MERQRRVDQVLFAVIMEASPHGMSTRNLYDLVKGTPCGHRDQQVCSASNYPKVEQMLRDISDDPLAFTGIAISHWKKIWAANPLE